jgi:hypothetical protein
VAVHNALSMFEHGTSSEQGGCDRKRLVNIYQYETRTHLANLAVIFSLSSRSRYDQGDNYIRHMSCVAFDFLSAGPRVLRSVNIDEASLFCCLFQVRRVAILTRSSSSSAKSNAYSKFSHTDLS